MGPGAAPAFSSGGLVLLHGGATGRAELRLPECLARALPEGGSCSVSSGSARLRKKRAWRTWQKPREGEPKELHLPPLVMKPGSRQAAATAKAGPCAGSPGQPELHPRSLSCNSFASSPESSQSEPPPCPSRVLTEVGAPRHLPWTVHAVGCTGTSWLGQDSCSPSQWGLPPSLWAALVPVHRDLLGKAAGGSGSR